MPPRPIVLLVPSMAAAVELPRRLASTGRALAGVYPFRLLDLARAIAEPALLGRGLKAWDTGHGALIAARLMDGSGFDLPRDLPRPPLAVALSRTLWELRMAGLGPEALEPLVRRTNDPDDRSRLSALCSVYSRFCRAVEGRFADPATLLRAARDHLGEARWLDGAEVLVVEDLEPAPVEQELLEGLARRYEVRLLEQQRPASLAPSPLAALAARAGIRSVARANTLLGPLDPPPAPEGLQRLRTGLFEAASGSPVRDGSVELASAPGEAAEVRAIVRRLLREAARGVPFEEMGVVLPRPHEYAPLFTDLFERLGIPYRLHPSLPLRFGRCARSLLLLFRCRELPRAAVMEFLTFAPVPFAELLGSDAAPEVARWDQISRDAKVVRGIERWLIGLRAHAEAEREAAAKEESDDRRERRLRRAADADALLRVVELLGATLDGLAGEASWPEWSSRLRDVFDQWIGPERDREPVSRVIAELAGLGLLGGRARWSEVEDVLEARFEWERLPVEPLASGAVHVGAMDAIAGLPFRVVAIPGLVEGGFPGVFRPDPFLLDPEREALAADAAPDITAQRGPEKPSRKGQLRLFEEASEATPQPVSAPPRKVGGGLPTTQDRLLEARRHFHRAVRQATERLILSYPRADPRSGRERMPSLFFVAAASAREGRALSAVELDRLVVEDDPETVPLEDALDRSERDRARVRAGGEEAAQRIAAGSAFFKQSRLASKARWSRRLTAYDGFVAPLPAEAERALDPLTAPWPVSASRLATYSRCGFLYLLQHVLRLEPVLEPEERKRLEPLERGDLFHRVAEEFLRERRQRGELPLRDTPGMRARLLEMAEQKLAALVEGSPPRFTALWDRERRRFRESVLSWLAREALLAEKATPAHFEVSFGPVREAAAGEPHMSEPLTVELGEGRSLRVSGKIDRIDRRPDGSLVLRDYKTGKAPRDQGAIYRGGQQLQIPFYVLAAAKMFPGQPVVEAFLDYVDGGRQVAFDPRAVTGEDFRALLRGLVDSIAQGVFVQEPSACDWCDYTAVCGPSPLLERRRALKADDPRLERVVRLRQIR